MYECCALTEIKTITNVMLKLLYAVASKQTLIVY